MVRTYLKLRGVEELNSGILIPKLTNTNKEDIAMTASKKKPLVSGSSRRKFLKGAGIAAATSTAAVILAGCDENSEEVKKKKNPPSAPNISRAETVTLKVQSSWGSKSVFQEMARQYVERVDKIDLAIVSFVGVALAIYDFWLHLFRN